MTSHKINELEEKIQQKTLTLVLLSIATAGIYPILWIYRNYSVINDITETKIVDDVFVIWLAVCVGLGSQLATSKEEVMVALGGILYIAGCVLYAVFAFKIRSTLREYALQKHKIDLPMNRFYTLIFTVYYINYCINDMKEVERKNTILKSRT